MVNDAAEALVGADLPPSDVALDCLIIETADGILGVAVYEPLKVGIAAAPEAGEGKYLAYGVELVLEPAEQPKPALLPTDD